MDDDGMIARLVWDGSDEVRIPPEMGEPRADQMQGTAFERLAELAGRVCYDQKTEVLTEDGWVAFPDLRQGIPVATFNRTTGMMEFQVPTDYIQKRHKGLMYRAETTKVSIRTTDDHQLWALIPRQDQFRLIRADNLAGNRYSVQRHAAYEGIPCEGVNLPTHRYTQRSASNHGQHGTMIRSTPGLEIGAGRILAWARFLGYYFSEGSSNKAGQGVGRRIVIYQSPETAGPIRETLVELGLPFRTHVDKRNGVLRFYVASGPVARYLDQFGSRAAEKRLPRECFGWPVPLRTALLDALMHGDGGVTAAGVRVYNTRSSKLADDVQELIIKSGRVGTISYTPVGDMHRVRESLHDLHKLNHHGPQDAMEPADEDVYCVSVPNRILVVRRDRKVVLCGNCYDSLGSGRDSAAYHQHILDVKNLSVLEHCNFTVRFPYASAAFGPAFLNRPGCYVRRLPDGIGWQVTLNLRAVLEWHRWNDPDVQGHHDGLNKIGQTIRHWANQLAPAYVPADTLATFAEVAVNGTGPNEEWITLYLAGSRGFSHELVRHGDFTAISQRSTRYVDESDAEPVMHPLIGQFLGDTAIPFARRVALRVELDSSWEQAGEVYAKLVNDLSAYLAERGADRLAARKQARGAARGYLGNALPTALIFSASVSQWLWMLDQRGSAGADAEIREIFCRALPELQRSRYGAAFNHLVLAPAPDGIGRVVVRNARGGT